MSNPPLFRDEARESLKVRLEGEVVAFTPPSLRKIAIALAATLVVLTGFAATASYTQYTAAAGILAPRSGLVTLTAPFKGDLVSITAKLGAPVKAGEPLALLRQSQVQTDGSVVAERERHLLASRKALTTEMLRAKEQELDSTITASLARVDGTKNALVAARATLESAKLQVIASKRYLDLQRKLIDEGFLASTGATTAERTYLGDVQAVRQAEQSVAAQQLDLTNAEQAVAQARSQRAALKAQSADNSAMLDLETSKLESSNEAVVTSQVAGTMAAVPALRGPVTAGAALFVVAPEGPTYAHLILNEQAAHKAKVGQHVVLRLMTSSRDDTARLTGVLEELSEAPVPTGPPEKGEQGYLAYVRLDASAQKAHVPLGARVEARLQVQTKSLLGWLFDPLVKGLRQTSLWH
jgi:membrane fusion protein